jgi:putative salt-induced outer membrane protein YdiY
MKYPILMAALAATTLSVQAAEQPKLGWNTSAELGAITTSGNTKGTSVSGKIDAKQELAQWSNEYVVSAFFKEDEKNDSNGNRFSEKSAERYFASGKAGYKLDTDHAKLFVFGSHTEDDFGAYTQYSIISAGYGDRLYQGEGISIDAEIGPGYYTGKTAGDLTEKGALVRTAGSLDWVISDSATFRQLLSLEASSDNKRTQSETSVSARINGSMQMKAAFTVQHDSEVPVNKKNTDTQTSLTLVYSF